MEGRATAAPADGLLFGSIAARIGYYFSDANVMTTSITGYWLGRTPTVACRLDQRFSYCLYVPPNYSQRPERPTLAVVIHDTLRNHQALRESFVDYTERANAIVLAPLFPAGIGTPDDLDHYKYLRFDDIRFDAVLLAM